MKKYNTLLTVILIALLFASTIYNHYDRIRSEKFIENQIKKHKKDVDYFTHYVLKFNKKANEIVDKLDKYKK